MKQTQAAQLAIKVTNVADDGSNAPVFSGSAQAIGAHWIVLAALDLRFWDRFSRLAAEHPLWLGKAHKKIVMEVTNMPLTFCERSRGRRKRTMGRKMWGDFICFIPEKAHELRC